MNTGIIYIAQSKSGKVYIGQTTKGLDYRIAHHIYSSKNQNGPLYNTKFYRALRKYPNINDWVFSILMKNIQYSELNHFERAFVEQFDSYKNGYNSTMGGGGGEMIGKKLTHDHKMKLSEANKGCKNAFWGKKHSRKTKKLLSTISKKRFASSDVLKVWSERTKKQFGTQETRNDMSKAKGGKEFFVFNKNTGEFVGSWINQHECAHILKLNLHHLNSCLKCRRKSHGGCIFRYKLD
jgi:group I intron endonuclease